MAPHAADESRVKCLGLGFHQARVHGYPMLFKLIKSFSGDAGIGIAHRRHHALYARLDQRLGARRRAALMTARLKGQIDRCVAGMLLCLFQGQNLGVRLTGARMPTLADNFIVLYDHAPHAWIGVRGVKTFPRQLQGARHIARIKNRDRHDFLPALPGLPPPAEPDSSCSLPSGISFSCLRRNSALGSFCRRCTSSRKASRSSKLRYTEAKRT